MDWFNDLPQFGSSSSRFFTRPCSLDLFKLPPLTNQALTPSDKKLGVDLVIFKIGVRN